MFFYHLVFHILFPTNVSNSFSYCLNRILNNPEWFEVLSWSRELAKSTVVMFCVMYLAMTGK